MGNAEDDGYPEHRAIFVPAHGLLMPKAGDDAEQGDETADGTEDGLSVPPHRAAANLAMGTLKGEQLT